MSHNGYIYKSQLQDVLSLTVSHMKYRGNKILEDLEYVLGDCVTPNPDSLLLFDGSEWHEMLVSGSAVELKDDQLVEYECNYCGTAYSGIRRAFTPHCPNCNALMRKITHV